MSTATASTQATLPPAISRLAGDIRNLPFEIRALVASLQKPSAAARNRRKSVRHPFLYEFALRVRDERGENHALRCHTRDRNDTHVAFLTDAMLPAGCEIVLDFTTSPDTHVLGQIPARVRRCRQFVGGWFECVAQAGVEARRERTSWERFTHWFGEFTGFGPDCRRAAGTQRVRVRKSA